MNYKNIVKRIAAVITTAAIALTTISPATLAATWTSNNKGGSIDYGVNNNIPYGYGENHNVAWRFDLFVSSNSNGIINPQTDIIDSTALPWVGAVMLGRFASNVFIQSDFTANRKPLAAGAQTPQVSEGFLSSSEYNLPHCYQYSNSTSDITDPTTGKKVFIVNEYYELPSDFASITESTYNSLVKERIESSEFTEKIFSRIIEGLGSSMQLLATVKPLLGEGVAAKVDSKIQELMAGSCTEEDAMALITPGSEECVVEGFPRGVRPRKRACRLGLLFLGGVMQEVGFH